VPKYELRVGQAAVGAQSVSTSHNPDKITSEAPNKDERLHRHPLFHQITPHHLPLLHPRPIHPLHRSRVQQPLPPWHPLPDHYSRPPTGLDPCRRRPNARRARFLNTLRRRPVGCQVTKIRVIGERIRSSLKTDRCWLPPHEAERQRSHSYCCRTRSQKVETILGL